MSEPTTPLTRPANFDPPAELAGLQSKALLVGIAGAVACGAGAFLDNGQFYRSYLIGLLLWTGVPAGLFALGLLQHVTGGRWGLAARRMYEAAGRTLPLVLLFWIPIFVGLPKLYVWARPERVHGDHLLEHKAVWLNAPGFIGRTVVFFALWSAFAFVLSRMSDEQDRTGDPALVRRMRLVSAGGLVVFVLTMSLSAIDWLMSLDPYWISSIYGVYMIGGQVLSAFAFSIIVALWLSRRAPMEAVLVPKRFHDYGKLMFAFVMLWAYFSFSQFLIIWSGNLAEEVSWYIHRMNGGWKWVALAIIVLHFALPFLLLLSQEMKKNAARLARVAGLVLVMRWVDIYWQAAPAYADAHGFHWLDIAAPVALGGLWVAAFFRELRRRPLLPARDPRLEEVLPHA